MSAAARRRHNVLRRKLCCIARDHTRSRRREPNDQPKRDPHHSVAPGRRVCVCGIGKTSERLNPVRSTTQAKSKQFLTISAASSRVKRCSFARALPIRLRQPRSCQRTGRSGSGSWPRTIRTWCRKRPLASLLLRAALVGYEKQLPELRAAVAAIRKKLGSQVSIGIAPVKRRKLSAAARKRIAAAQKKRWAEFHKKQK